MCFFGEKMQGVIKLWKIGVGFGSWEMGFFVWETATQFVPINRFFFGVPFNRISAKK
jgi:hypothetical protein